MSLKINGKKVDVDIEEELQEYEWSNARWTSSKLISSSPFRYDKAPSFFVDLETGGWADSGSYDDEFSKGNFVKLIAHLRGIYEHEAEEYLINKYGLLYEIKEGHDIHIEAPRLRERKKEYALSSSTVTQAVSPYLITRGIAPDVQERYGIGYNENNKGYTAIPWHYSDTGDIANVKYRSTSSKRFFYEPDAKSISELVYGLWQAKTSPYVIICEGEIDALSWATAGYTAVALGGAHITRRQSELIVREGFKKIYVAADNDDQGRSLNRKVYELLKGYARIYEVDYREEKDANDVLLRHGVGGLDEIFDTSKELSFIHLHQAKSRLHPQ